MNFKNGFLYIIILTSSFICVSVGNAEISSTDDDWLSQQMDLSCDGRPLKQVIEDVAAFFQTEIVYQADEADRTLQCSYSRSTVEQIISRLFRKQNRAILIENTPKRQIIVQVFGVSEYHVVSNDGVNSTENFPFLAGMTNESLAIMQKEQLKKYREELEDSDAIIPGVGLTRAEITKLHQQQIQQNEKNLQDPAQNVAGTKMTRQQLTVTQEEQLRQYEHDKLDNNLVDPFTGLTTEEISELHQKQIQQQQN